MVRQDRPSLVLSLAVAGKFFVHPLMALGSGLTRCIGRPTALRHPAIPWRVPHPSTRPTLAARTDVLSVVRPHVPLGRIDQPKDRESPGAQVPRPVDGFAETGSPGHRNNIVGQPLRETHDGPGLPLPDVAADRTLQVLVLSATPALRNVTRRGSLGPLGPLVSLDLRQRCKRLAAQLTLYGGHERLACGPIPARSRHPLSRGGRQAVARAVRVRPRPRDGE